MGVSCHVLYSFVVCLYVSVSGSLTSVGEERVKLSAVVYLLLCGFCSERFPLPLDAWMGYVILLWHTLSLPYNSFDIKVMLRHSCLTLWMAMKKD